MCIYIYTHIYIHRQAATTTCVQSKLAESWAILPISTSSSNSLTSLQPSISRMGHVSGNSEKTGWYKHVKTCKHHGSNMFLSHFCVCSSSCSSCSCFCSCFCSSCSCGCCCFVVVVVALVLVVVLATQLIYIFAFLWTPKNRQIGCVFAYV